MALGGGRIIAVNMTQDASGSSTKYYASLGIIKNEAELATSNWYADIINLASKENFKKKLLACLDEKAKKLGWDT